MGQTSRCSVSVLLKNNSTMWVMCMDRSYWQGKEDISKAKIVNRRTTDGALQPMKLNWIRNQKETFARVRHSTENSAQDVTAPPPPPPLLMMLMIMCVPPPSKWHLRHLPNKPEITLFSGRNNLAAIWWSNGPRKRRADRSNDWLTDVAFHHHYGHQTTEQRLFLFFCSNNDGLKMLRLFYGWTA